MSRALSSSSLPKSRIAPRWGVEVRILWGDRILGEHFLHAGADRVFQMGSAAGVDFAMSAHLFDQESFDVVVSRNGAFELHFTEKMPGTLWKHGEAQELQALISSRIAEEVRDGVFAAELSWGDAACIEFGPLRFEVASRKAPTQVLVPLEEKVDFAFLSVALVMFLIGAGFVTTALTVNTDAYSDELSSDDRERIVKVFYNAMKAPQTNALLQEHAAKKEKQAAREASKKPEGKLGAVDAPKVEKKGNTHKQAAAALARNIFGPGNSAIFASMDKSMEQALGGIKGKEIGLSDRSLGGLGLKGDKDGGGGNSDLFQIGGINRGKGVKVVGGPDYGSGILCAKPPCKTVTEVGIDDPPKIIGSLDRELIRQVIHAHHSQIRYCYESELQRAPNLGGKVGVKFVITASGTVSIANVASTTMNNAAVETCVASRVRTWIFPKPRGGGQVIVQYPFVFKSTAQ